MHFQDLILKMHGIVGISIILLSYRVNNQEALDLIELSSPHLLHSLVIWKTLSRIEKRFTVMRF